MSIQIPQTPDFPDDLPDYTDTSLPTTERQTVSFSSQDRASEMHNTVAAWLYELGTVTESSAPTHLVSRWVSTASSFPGLSPKNTILLSLQAPNATYIAGYDQWNDQHQGRIRSGADAIYIWDKIIEPQCPDCGNAPNKHRQSDCDYDETGPEDWETGIVGFAPGPVYTDWQVKRADPPLQHRLWRDISEDQAANILRRSIKRGSDALGINTTISKPPSESEEELPTSRITTGEANLQLDQDLLSDGRGTSYNPIPEQSMLTARSNRITLPPANNSTAQKISRTVHQVATALVTGTATPRIGHEALSKNPPSTVLELQNRIVEAELVSHIVATRVGVEPPRDLSDAPLGRWYGEDINQIETRLERVLRAAELIAKYPDQVAAGAAHNVDGRSPYSLAD